LYSRRLRGHFEQAIRKKYLKLSDLISLLPHEVVVVDQEETATLQNINSQKDLNRLL
jgi:molybdopterin-guanine dinucleotide biosynthesis protein A